MCGNFTKGTVPCRILTSVAQMVVALTETVTSSAREAGTGTSASSNLSGSVKTTARISHHFPFNPKPEPSFISALYLLQPLLSIYFDTNHSDINSQINIRESHLRSDLD